VTDLELTEEMIAAAMAKADARVCVGSDRCYAFPASRATTTALTGDLAHLVAADHSGGEGCYQKGEAS
jgi:hypothetical protein